MREDRKQGFSLIEMILALATMGLILGAAYNALFSGLNSYRLSAYESEVYGVVGSALERIFADVACTHLGQNGRFRVIHDELESEEYGLLAMDQLLFQANVSRLDWKNKPQSDVCEIEYYIDMDEETPARWLVRRYDTPADSNLLEGGEINLVGPRVIGMDVTCFNGSGWVDSWDSDTELPQAIKVRLFIAPSSDSMGSSRLDYMTSTITIPRGLVPPLESEAETPASRSRGSTP